ncbi:hypothetical protein [Actinocorallia libanotica]|uniref:hypothetical protein n=1 Tax=Actinocorallia libanotica TaxID=46162 RepID=UPI0031DBD299
MAEVCLARSVLDPAGAQQELYEQISTELSADIKMKVLEVSLVPEGASLAFAQRLESVLRRRKELDQMRQEIFADPVRAALWFVDGRPDRMLTLADPPSAAAFDEARERLSGSLGVQERQSLFEIIGRARELDPRLWAYALGKLAASLRELGAENVAAALEREIADG